MGRQTDGQTGRRTDGGIKKRRTDTERWAYRFFRRGKKITLNVFLCAMYTRGCLMDGRTNKQADKFVVIDRPADGQTDKQIDLFVM